MYAVIASSTKVRIMEEGMMLRQDTHEYVGISYRVLRTSYAKRSRYY